MRTEPTPSAGARDMRDAERAKRWEIVYEDQRPGARPDLVVCLRRGREGIMLSLDMRRRTEERWGWARTYLGRNGQISFARGFARSKADASRAAKEVAP